MPTTRLSYTCRQACNVAFYCFYKIVVGIILLLGVISVSLDFTLRLCAWPFVFCLFHHTGKDRPPWVDCKKADGFSSQDLWRRCLREMYLQNLKFKNDYTIRRKNWELQLLADHLPSKMKQEVILGPASLQSPSSSLLLKLPPELRRMIYEYVFASAKNGIMYLYVVRFGNARQREQVGSIAQRKKSPPHLYTLDSGWKQLALVRVCRQTYMETINLLYSELHLQICNDRFDSVPRPASILLSHERWILGSYVRYTTLATRSNQEFLASSRRMLQLFSMSNP